MKKNVIIGIFIINILVSLVYSEIRLLYSGEFNLVGMLFNIWIASPYFLITILFRILYCKKYLISSFMISVICLISTLYAYYDISSSSTAVLVFLISPLYLNIGLPLIYLIFLIIENIKFNKNY